MDGWSSKAATMSWWLWVVSTPSYSICRLRRTRSTASSIREAVCKALAADIGQSVILANRLLKEFMMSDGESAADGRNGAPVGDLSVLIRGTQDKVATYLVHARARQRRMLNL